MKCEGANSSIARSPCTSTHSGSTPPAPSWPSPTGRSASIARSSGRGGTLWWPRPGQGEECEQFLCRPEAQSTGDLSHSEQALGSYHIPSKRPVPSLSHPCVLSQAGGASEGWPTPAGPGTDLSVGMESFGGTLSRPQSACEEEGGKGGLGCDRSVENVRNVKLVWCGVERRSVHTFSGDELKAVHGQVDWSQAVHDEEVAPLHQTAIQEEDESCVGGLG